MQEHGLGTDVPLKDPGRPVSSFAAQFPFECPPGKEAGKLTLSLLFESDGLSYWIEHYILNTSLKFHMHRFVFQQTLLRFVDYYSSTCHGKFRDATSECYVIQSSNKLDRLQLMNIAV